MTMSEAQKKAQKKYKLKNRERNRKSTAKSQSKKYVYEFANAEELLELKEMIINQIDYLNSKK